LKSYSQAIGWDSVGLKFSGEHKTFRGYSMQIIVGEKNLENLFSGKQHVSVPGFQRSYAWTTDQVNEFWTDLKDSAVSGESHFWGPIVLLDDSHQETELKLIDGQQRITTAMIALSILRDAAFVLETRIIRAGLPGEQDVLNMVRNFLFRPVNYTEPKFTASYLIDEVFKSHIISDPIGFDSKPRPELTVGGKGLSPAAKRATKELRRAYLRLKELMTKFLQSVPEARGQRAEKILALFTALTSGFEIHSMKLTSEDDAYVLFETLNDRGLQLNPSDLLKTLTLRQIKQHSKPDVLEAALKTWDKMVQNLGDYDFSKFLRHYLLTQTKHPVQSKKIFSYFKLEIESMGFSGAEKNLHKLVAASETYAKLLGTVDSGDEELTASIHRMNSFSDTHRVFLLSVLQAGLPIDLARLLFRSTEYLAARWILAGDNAQELEGHYQVLAHEIEESPNAETAQIVSGKMMQLAPIDGALTLIHRSEQKDLQRYFLRRIEEESGGLTLAWDKPITIEHLAPQNPANDDYWTKLIHRLPGELEDDFSYEDTIQQWGNLTLLEKKLNSSIQNSKWDRKVAGDKATKYDGLSASTLNLNKPLVVVPEWNRTTVEIRNLWISKASLDLVSKQWVSTGKVKLEKLVF
jgi:hypothetical protein